MELIILTDLELEDFDITDTTSWELRGETYVHKAEQRTDKYSDGESWDTVVQRISDLKYFKWNVWDSGVQNGYLMSDGDNTMEEVFPVHTMTTTYTTNQKTNG